MEQYKQGGVSEFSPETDIYALGATFFKLLTGKTPPSASDVFEDGVPVDELKARGVSQEAIGVIKNAMEPKKKDRMKDVHLFLALKQDSNIEPSPSSQHSSPSQHSAVVEEDEATVVATSRPAQGPDEPQTVGESGSQMKILFFILAFLALVIFIAVRTIDSGEINDDDYYDGDSVVCDGVAERNFNDNTEKNEWIDLGLSVKWSSCSEGAKRVSEIGHEYSWHEAKKIETKDGARLPTRKEAEELLRKCELRWTKCNGQTGFKVTGINGNSIFLPAAGKQTVGWDWTVDAIGNYWTSDVFPEVPDNAYELELTETQQCVSWWYCTTSRCVRLVHP